MSASPHPRWLDEEEQQAWFGLATVLMRLPLALDAQLERDAGISHFEYVVMARLSTMPERTLRMSLLAALAGGSLPRLSQAVGRLEKRRWVSRMPDPADGRYTLAMLTDQGWDKVVTTAPGHVETVRGYVFDQLTRVEMRELASIVQHIVGALPPDNTWPSVLPSIQPGSPD